MTEIPSIYLGFYSKNVSLMVSNIKKNKVQSKAIDPARSDIIIHLWES